MASTLILLKAAIALAGCHAVDGDTIKCEGQLMRLLAIDAPEAPGHCRRGRTCAPGDWKASRDALTAGMQLGPLTMRQAGQDKYRRPLIQLFAGTIDLSCRQLQLGQAIPVPKWDHRGWVLSQCDLTRRNLN